MILLTHEIWNWTQSEVALMIAICCLVCSFISSMNWGGGTAHDGMSSATKRLWQYVPLKSLQLNLPRSYLCASSINLNHSSEQWIEARIAWQGLWKLVQHVREAMMSTDSRKCYTHAISKQKQWSLTVSCYHTCKSVAEATNLACNLESSWGPI